MSIEPKRTRVSYQRLTLGDNSRHSRVSVPLVVTSNVGSGLLDGVDYGNGRVGHGCISCGFVW
jgi:hypothetical protein